jgi:WD40 repeat protein
VALRQVAESTLDRAIQLCAANETTTGLLLLAQGLRVATQAGATDLEEVFRWNIGSWSREAHALDVMLPHTSEVFGVAYSPDGKTIATGSADGKLRRWESRGGKLAGAPAEHPAAVLSLAFHPSGSLVATCCQDGLVRLWKPNEGGPVLKFRFQPADRPVWLRPGIAFSPDGGKILTGGIGGSARLWDAATGNELTAFRYSAPGQLHTNGVAFSRDGQTVLAANSGGQAQLSDPQTGKTLCLPIRTLGANTGAAFSPDGQQFATAHYGHWSAQMWDRETGKPVGPPLQHHHNVLCLAYSPDGRWLVTGGMEYVAHIWDVATGAPVGAPLRHGDSVNAVAFSPDGRALATASSDGNVCVWKPAAGALRRSISLAGPGTWAAFTPDSRYVAVGLHGDMSNDRLARHIRLWDLLTGEPSGTSFDGTGWSNGFVMGLAFNRDGSRLYVGSHRHVVIWDTATGKQLHQLVLPGPSHEVYRLALSSDETKVAVSPAVHQTKGPAYLWDLRRENTPPKTLEVPGAGVVSVEFGDEGRVLWTGCTDGTIRRWNTATGAAAGAPGRFTGHIHTIAVRPTDGAVLAVGSSDRFLRQLDAVTWQSKGPLLPHPGLVSEARYNRDGRLIITTSERAALVWHAQTGRRVGPPLSHSDHVWGLAISPDDEMIATTGYKDRLARLWLMPVRVEGRPADVMRWVERLTGQALGQDGSVKLLKPEAWRSLN